MKSISSSSPYLLAFLSILCTKCGVLGNKTTTAKPNASTTLTEANPFEHKYQASIRLRDVEKAKGFGVGHICGGCLITDVSVLTSAYCFKDVHSYDYSNYLVVLGVTSLTNKSKALVFPIVRVKIHPQYREMHNDVAVVRLRGRVHPRYSGRVRPVIIVDTPPRPGLFGFATGFNKVINPPNYNLSDELLASELVIIDLTSCETLQDNQTKRLLCLEFVEGSGCVEKTGGPLVANNRLIGLSIYAPCEYPKQPMLYSHIYFFRHWIFGYIAKANCIRFSLLLNVLMTLLRMGSGKFLMY